MKQRVWLLVFILKFMATGETPVYELFIYSGCPYGTEAVFELLKVTDSLSGSKLNIWFSGDILEIEDKTVFKTGLDGGSVEDELYFLGVKTIYPNRFKDFIWLISKQNLTIKKAVSELEIDKIKIDKWIKTDGKKLLISHYKKSVEFQISSSPTLFIRGRRYSANPSYENLAFEECRGDTTRAECYSFGNCFKDAHCQTDSLLGVCDKSGKFGKCISLKEPKLELIAIIPDEYEKEDIYDFLSETSLFFPSLSPVFIKQSDKKASKFLALSSRSTLPIFFFDKSVATLHNYGEIKNSVEKIGDFYSFKTGVVEGNYFFKREKKNNHILFISPTNPELLKIEHLKIEHLKKELLKKDLFQRKSSLIVLPNPQNSPSSKESKLTKSWLKEDGINLSVEEFIDNYLDGVNLEPTYLLFINNRELFSLKTYEEVVEILEWIGEKNGSNSSVARE